MNSKEIIVEKKWSFLLLFLILFFTPGFFFWADNLLIKEKIIAFAVCFLVFFALSGISFFLKKKTEKLYLAALFLLSMMPNTVVWSYLYMSDTFMCRDMFWVLYATNTTESGEYFEQFISWQMYAMAAGYILSGFLLLYKSGSSHALSFKKYTAFFSSCVIMLVLAFVLQHLTTGVGVSTFDYYVSGVNYLHESAKIKEEFQSRKAGHIPVVCALPDSTNQVFVVVIGESLTRTHMHLYGYFRETTPRLNEMKNEMDVYTDVVTADNYTIGALKKVLTFADHDHPGYYTEKPSVVELFKSAGFETYWISNQEFMTKWGGSYGLIAEESDHVYDLRIAQQDDEIVLPVLDTVLADNSYKRKVIFIHLMGSHHLYSARYPHNFKHFDYRVDTIPQKSFLNDGMRKKIDEYDNSVRYTDYVLSSIINRVKSANHSSFVLFFSDHGEEVYDVRNVCAHQMSNIYAGQCEVPFVLWRSEMYKQEKPDITIETSRPYSLEQMIFSLSDLAGLKYDDYKPELSIFSKEYKRPDKRMVADEDYDREIVKKKYNN